MLAINNKSPSMEHLAIHCWARHIVQARDRAFICLDMTVTTAEFCVDSEAIDRHAKSIGAAANDQTSCTQPNEMQTRNQMRKQ